MTIISAKHSAIRMIQGFAAHVIGNDEVELAVVPELGAKIISLKNLRTRREWLWHPTDQLKLFKNQPRDDYSASPLAGIDECLPTISPCAWHGRDLPDHGEAWNQPWQVDQNALQNGILATSIKLKTSPLTFKRTLELHGNEVKFEYQLTNLSDASEQFIWAMHPLLRLHDGDALEMPRSTRELLNGETWIEAVASAIPEKGCAKVFASSIREGWVAIENQAQGDRLEFVWNPGEMNTVGLWLNRGGWHGHHHFAIEPTNGNHDSLAVAAGGKCCGNIAAHGALAWNLSLHIGQAQ
jgi:galactose mutarotase-like enzyme